MVYLTPTTATSGGYFPNGVNGSLNSSGGHDARRRPATGGTKDKGLLTAGGIAAYATRQHTTTNQDKAS